MAVVDEGFDAGADFGKGVAWCAVGIGLLEHGGGQEVILVVERGAEDAEVVGVDGGGGTYRWYVLWIGEGEDGMIVVSA